MAKKILTLFVSLSISLSIFSQGISLIENGSVWKESHITIAGPMLMHNALCGDTLINGILYNQLVALQVDSQMQVTNKSFLAGLREDGHSVYAKFNGGLDEVLLYDFSLEPGDTITLTLAFGTDEVVRKVDSTDVQLLAGKMRKVIYFQNDGPNCSYPPEYWIEGIGSSYGIWLRALDPCTIFDAGGQLLCYRNDTDYLNLTLIECFLPDLDDCSLSTAVDDPIYELANFAVYPNPASNFISIKSPIESTLSDWQISVYNAFAEKVATPTEMSTNGWEMDVTHLPQGIYFVRMMDEANRLVGFGKFLKM